MTQTIEELAYDLSRAAVADQKTRANEFRTRTGTLLAAAAVTASFFGAQAVAAHELDTAGLLALVAYLCSVAAGLIVLLPRRLVVEFRGTVLLASARRTEADLSEVYAAATEWLESFHQRNRYTLVSLERWYTTALMALGAEIVLWTASVVDTLW
ncbi:MAG TPA: hypothetical protein VNB64_10230 [Solirubrobacteraceae bacterium]|nr:hypothetical protein [Solirubrobacteraceae bacterium]